MSRNDDWEHLAEGTSRTDHTCRGGGPDRCRGCRWFETRLYRRLLPESIEYKIEIVGRSLVPGEVDRLRVEHTTSASAVIDFLSLGESHSRYIPKISRKVLHEAADIDEAIGEALDDFDTITAP